MSADHSDQIKRIVSEFRAGRLSRRQFLGMVAALSGGAAMSAAGRPSISVRDLFAPETQNRLAAAPWSNPHQDWVWRRCARESPCGLYTNGYNS